MVRHNWSQEEIHILTENYPQHTWEVLATYLPHIPKNTIRNKAKRLKLKKIRLQPTLDCLLANTPESNYWMGFLLGDGSFIFSKKIVKLQIAEKDYNHLNIYSTFCGKGIIKTQTICNGKYFPSNIVTISHKSKFDSLCGMYDIQANKTYNPPNLNNIQTEHYLPLFIGLIDADGYVHTRRNQYNTITIQSHKAWSEFYTHLIEKLNVIYNLNLRSTGNIYPSRPNIWTITICGNDCISLLNYAEELRLPLLTRKWSRLNIPKP